MTIKASDQTFDSVGDWFDHMQASRSRYRRWVDNRYPSGGPVRSLMLFPHRYIRDLPGDLWREAKTRHARSRKGWAPQDVWSMNHYITTVLPDMLANLRDNLSGWPSNLPQDVEGDPDPLAYATRPVSLGGDDAYEREGMASWRSLLTEMEDGLRAAHELLDTRIVGHHSFMSPDERVWESREEIEAYEAELQARFERGWTLMGKWLPALWD